MFHDQLRELFTVDKLNFDAQFFSVSHGNSLSLTRYFAGGNYHTKVCSFRFDTSDKLFDNTFSNRRLWLPVFRLYRYNLLECPGHLKGRNDVGTFVLVSRNDPDLLGSQATQNRLDESLKTKAIHSPAT